MTNQELVLGLIIIFIIYVCISLPKEQAIILIIGILVIAYVKVDKNSNIEQLKYRNIQHAKDIDTLQQNPYTHDKNQPYEWDNSDIISAVVDDTANVYNYKPDPFNYGVFLKRNNVNARSYNADQAIANAQVSRANRNKEAITGQVRHTKNSYSKFFQNELDQNERREWWNDPDYENEWEPWL